MHTPQTRYLFLEMLALWQGYVRNKDLVNQFVISRQQAYQDIRAYQKHYPGRLYRTSTGPYQFTPQFIEQASKHSLEDYLHWLTTGQFYAPKISQHALFGEFCVAPQRYVAPRVIAALTEAIRQQKRVELGYVSLSHPEWQGRIFHPHTFVKTSLRWHVRGYCEKSQDYRDLVLSRCRGDAEVLDTSQYTQKDDYAWNTQVTLIFAPDPRLSEAQKEVVSHDYQLKNGQVQISTRAALVNYLLKEMQINPQYLEGTPEAQQVILVNPDDVKPWLFGR
ncbi:Predicted DNA-binding transcriptional regulator YafY, contains an HTH and WYL domains [Allopseudospirillum japonicum]|uniref:Predicted DNA-binding transcriptional regulator YafY, contains an HTH and WYL domains n=1 Tax=Allopseudospirillum japonicum TaxID=64971 RepID=A0A1H6SEZ8_9GAMM|nr:WYL domain-containing protein [Allopseudospirillum japonicum]SEI63357.1 Predicted DNA-binding transcriptional regulator YafY, contains an HTH and WYL domains [Allopseudospirillum japonicum]